MNPNHTPSREKWDILADDKNILQWPKGQTLFYKVQKEQMLLMKEFEEKERERENDGKKTPARITRSVTKEASTKAATSDSKRDQNISL